MTPKEEITLFLRTRQLEQGISLVDDYIRRFYPDLPSVELIFERNLSINACANIIKGAYSITINDGLQLIIHNMFLSMLATKTVLPEVGNLSIETDSRKRLNLFMERFYDSSAPRMEAPNDYTRHALAICLIHQVFTFVTLHEYCHLIRGHVGALIDDPKLKEDILFRQTLEMDADSFASNRSLQLWFENNENKLYPPDVPIYKDLHSFLKYWSFAIYSFFRISGFMEKEDERHKSLHPPARIRMQWIALNVIPIIQNHLPCETAEKICETVFQGCFEAEEAFNSISSYESEFHLFADTFSSEDKYSEIVLANWNRVRGIIEPFAHGVLPPLH